MYYFEPCEAISAPVIDGKYCILIRKLSRIQIIV